MDSFPFHVLSIVSLFRRLSFSHWQLFQSNVLFTSSFVEELRTNCSASKSYSAPTLRVFHHGALKRFLRAPSIRILNQSVSISLCFMIISCATLTTLSNLIWASSVQLCYKAAGLAMRLVSAGYKQNSLTSQFAALKGSVQAYGVPSNLWKELLQEAWWWIPVFSSVSNHPATPSSCRLEPKSYFKSICFSESFEWISSERWL